MITRTELAAMFAAALESNPNADYFPEDAVRRAFLLADTFLSAAGAQEEPASQPAAGVIRGWVTRDAQGPRELHDTKPVPSAGDDYTWPIGWLHRAVADAFIPGEGGPDAICEIEIRRVTR